MSRTIDLSALGMIWKRDLIRLGRDRATITGSLARPILWLLILGVGMGSTISQVGGVSYVEYLFPGIVALNLLFASFLSAISIIWDREFGFLKEMLVAPISRVSIAVGKTASGATVATLQGGIVLCFVPFVGASVSLQQVLLSVPLMLLISFGMTSLGLSIASRMSSFEGFGTIANFVIMPMFFISGAVFPLDQAPPWLKILSRANPMTYAVDLLRGVFLGLNHRPLWIDLAILLGFSLCALWLAVRAFCRRL